jgi:GNAT superfamily N-acetyltransferase
MDPLLPAPAPVDTTHEILTVDGATGTHTRRTLPAGAPETLWSATDQFRLSPHLAGDPDGAHRPAALDRLLTAWRETIAEPAGTAGEDSAAYVRLPSRDTALVPALTRHGLHPYVVIAARPHGRPAASEPSTGDTADIRRATAADAEPVARLSLALTRFETRFGTAYERPDTPRHVRDETDRALAEPDPWVWLAEARGEPVGVLVVSPPHQAGWLAALARPRPMAYLATAWVDPSVRHTGIGTALATAAHRVVDAAGIAVTLLHYGALNALSGPFWHRMGYRPLWTDWRAQPAATLR